jgi:hypothetical protein
MTTPSRTTLLNLVQAVSECAASDDEVVATVAYLINSGRVRLCGTFAGASIDVSPTAGAMPPSSTLPLEMKTRDSAVARTPSCVVSPRVTLFPQQSRLRDMTRAIRAPPRGQRPEISSSVPVMPLSRDTLGLYPSTNNPMKKEKGYDEEDDHTLPHRRISIH